MTNINIYLYVVLRTAINNNKPSTFEEVYIRYKRDKKLETSSTFILDIYNEELLKNRYEFSQTTHEYTYETVLEHLSKQHEDVSQAVEYIKGVKETISNVIQNMEEGSEEVSG